MTKRACRQEHVNPAARNIRETPEYVARMCMRTVYGVLAGYIFVSLFAFQPLSLKILPSCSLKQIGNAQFAPLHFFLPVPSACLFP